MQEVEATIINGKGTETGHIIVTTTGGKNGQPKQVTAGCHISLGLAVFCSYLFVSNSACMILSLEPNNIILACQMSGTLALLLISS
jgi:hypothetical protein